MSKCTNFVVRSRGGTKRETWEQFKIAFHSRVQKGDANECWPWLDYCQDGGYGQIKYKGKGLICSRLAWQFANGDADPGDKKVMHSCDNPPCCNPAHLSLGTDLDNRMDCAKKGRFPTKLTKQSVIEIRNLAKTGFTHTKISKIYKSCRSNISQIIREETWTHI